MCLLPAGAFSLAQQRQIDSLTALVQAAAADTQKVNWQNELSWKYFSMGEFEKGRQYAQEALQLATQLGFKNGLGVAQNDIGVAHKNLGNYAAALEWYYKALATWESRQDKKGMASTLNNIGVVYKMQGDYEKALEKYKVSLKLGEEFNDRKALSSSLNNIGLVYSALRRFDEALDYYSRALLLEDKAGNKYLLSILLNNIGTVHESRQAYDTALVYYKRALEIEKNIGNAYSEATSYMNIANVLIKVNLRANAAEAEKYLNKALAMSQAQNNKDNIKDCYSRLSEIHSLRVQHQEALAEFKLYVAYRDSLFNEENTKKSVQAEMNFEFEKREAAARLEQEKKDAVAAAESRRQRILLFSVSGFGLLVLAFAAFAWRSFLQKKKSNLAIRRQKELIEVKQKEILDSIHYARRIQRSLLPAYTLIQRNLRRLNAS